LKPRRSIVLLDAERDGTVPALVGDGRTLHMGTFVFQNCTLLDCTGADPAPRSTAIVEDDRIRRVRRGTDAPPPNGATVIDCGGRTLMPGLTDAHVHAAIVETDPAKARRESAATLALRIKSVLEETLDAGFTTIRDAFGLDWGFAQATERGLVRGPRILFVGACLSQTGGHGDWREPYHAEAPIEGVWGLAAMPRIADARHRRQTPHAFDGRLGD